METDLSPLCHQQDSNVVGLTLKCPNKLYGALTMQASIRGVNVAWQEQCNPLGLMSAVQGTVGCSSSSLQVFYYVIFLHYRLKWSIEPACNVFSLFLFGCFLILSVLCL